MLDCQIPDPDAPPSARHASTATNAEPQRKERRKYPTFSERMDAIRERERLRALSDDPDPWLTRKEGRSRQKKRETTLTTVYIFL